MYTAWKNALHERMLIKCPGIQHEVRTHVLSNVCVVLICALAVKQHSDYSVLDNKHVWCSFFHLL